MPPKTVVAMMKTMPIDGIESGADRQWTRIAFVSPGGLAWRERASALRQ